MSKNIEKKNTVNATVTKKNVKNKGAWNDESVRNMVKKMVNLRNEYMNDVENRHVKFCNGNRKTSKIFDTLSLLPVVDCPNCKGCMHICYDFRHDVIIPSVMKNRANNSAIHKADPERFWKEVELNIELRGTMFLRINVGGDLLYDDFTPLNEIAKRHKEVTFHFFTKNYDGINKWLDENGAFEKNIKAIISNEEGMGFSNPHHLTEFSIYYPDGSCTAPTYGATFCKGNCSRCFLGNEDGCATEEIGAHIVCPLH